ncbi:RNA-directed DNA polymerase, eukaryota, reverse transcriptase zinc-binding domain protein [Tanacetum coccineum]
MPLVITCAAALNICFNVSGVESLIESILTDLEFFDDGFATKAKERFNDSFQGYDVLGFWKAKESTFPVLSHMAWDILSVQDTSVASESALSTSGRVLSIRRTRLTPNFFSKVSWHATERIHLHSNLETAIRISANKYAVLNEESDIVNENENGNEEEVIDVYDETSGNRSKQNAVKDLIVDEKLSICAVLETRLKDAKVKRIGNRVFGRWKCYGNAMECNKGRKVLKCGIIHASDQAVLCLFDIQNSNQRLFCTFIHAEISGKLRRKLWADLSNYKSIVNDTPWVITGDLNVSLNLEDHFEGMSHLTKDMEEFRECINHVQMEDICSSGLHYTWIKSLLNPNNKIMKKIDRVMGSYAMFKLVKMLKAMKSTLNKLNWKNGNLFEKVKKLKLNLDEIQTKIDADPTNISLREQGHFQKFLGVQENMECLDLDESLFLNKISPQDAGNLINDVTNKEIKDAMFDINDNKALGPDGFTARFFKRAWDIVGNDVCLAVNELFTKGNLLEELNAAIITLVPKLLKGYDNGRGPKICSMKIDIQKAYDTMNWKFLKDALRLFGFHPKMIQWISLCVTTPSYTICLNGERYGFFKGGRGLRQGDPLSPYLFTMVMEVFNLILQQEIKVNRNFKYHHGCKELEITHICFADDLLVLCHRDVASVKVIKTALDKFSSVYGLFPNLGKSTIFCGSMDRGTIGTILQILPFKKGKLLVRYLGVLLVSNKIRIKGFYWASVFKLPKGVIDDIEKTFKGFLWNKGDLQNGKAKWEPIGMAKLLFEKYPILLSFSVPRINDSTEDRLVWRTNEGILKPFSTNQAWKDIRILNGIVQWWKVIWFSQNIPSHAFVSWMAMKNKLVTHDKLAAWYPGKVWNCSLCKKTADSHEHLFLNVSSLKRLLSLKVKNYRTIMFVERIWKVVLGRNLERCACHFGRSNFGGCTISYHQFDLRVVRDVVQYHPRYPAPSETLVVF